MVSLFLILGLLVQTEELPLYHLDEIVVTAPIISGALKDAPLGVVIITEEVIRESGQETVADILRCEAGIDIKSSGGLGSVSSLSIRGSSSSQVLVLMDGRPLNSISLGMCDMSKLSLSNVKRIEVIKGPVSSLYGANALGGVVNIITKDTASDKFVSGKSSLGPFETRAFDLSAGKDWGTVSLFVSGNIYSTAGLRSNSNFDQQEVRANMTYKIHQNSSLKVSLGYVHSQQGIPGPKPAEGVIPAYGDSTASTIFDSQEDNNYFIDVLATNQWDRLESKTRLYWDNRKQKFFRVYDLFDMNDFTLHKQEANDEYRTHILGLNEEISLNIGRMRLAAGAGFRKNNFKGESVVYDTVTKKDTTTHWEPSNWTFGGWIEAKVPLLDRWLFFPSLRYDKNSDYGGYLSPGLGLVLSLGRGARLKLFGGQAYRAPTFNDLYWPNAGNPDLEPEIGESYEIRLERGTPDIFMAISLFFNKTRNLIAWAPDTSGWWYPSNVNKFNAGGLEVEFRTPFIGNAAFDIKGTFLLAQQIKKEIVYSYYDWLTGETETRFEERERQATFLPEISLSYGIKYKTPFDGLVGLDIKCISERVNYYSIYDFRYLPRVLTCKKTLPAVMLVGLNFSKGVGDFSRINFRIDNLLDQEYYEQFGNFLLDRDYPLAGRNYKLTMELSL